MDWFVCFMSGHPEVQAKCREEIGNIGGFYNKPYRYNHSILQQPVN